jgi:hypothetical protein
LPPEIDGKWPFRPFFPPEIADLPDGRAKAIEIIPSPVLASVRRRQNSPHRRSPVQTKSQNRDADVLDQRDAMPVDMRCPQISPAPLSRPASAHGRRRKSQRHSIYRNPLQ